MDTRNGVFFTDEYQEHLKDQFSFADSDPEYGHRLFFENSGGSLRLKQAVEIKRELEEFPDCPERSRGRGKDLGVFVTEGTREIMNIVFGTSQGALITDLTASQAMFQAVSTILENVKWGSNAVTTQLEHPSAHDAVEYACIRTGREFREIPANPETGGIDVEEVLKHVDENTVLVSVMAASNISGNIMDIKEISRRVHEINPDIRDLTNMPNDSQGTIRYGRLNMRSFLRRVKRDFAVWNQITPVPAGCAVCMTHLNEYDHCGARNKLVKYKSSSEEGAGCVTLNNNTR